MASYNCLKICLEEAGLLSLACQSIVLIKKEISHIRTLLNDSSSLLLSSQDLSYYRQELESILHDNNELLLLIVPFTEALHDCASMQ